MRSFDDSKLSVEELALRTRWRELVKRNGEIQRKVARVLGMSPQKMSRHCTGEQLPSDEELVRLCLHRHLKPEEEEELLNLLDKARKARASRESKAAEDPPSRWKEFRENRKLIAATIVAVVLIAAGVVWGTLSSRSSSSASPTSLLAAPTVSSRASKPDPVQSLRVWPAQVANAPHGTYLYHGPFEKGNDLEPAGSKWNTNSLSIVCQESHGRTIRDDTVGKASTVWSKLDDGKWIPTMYTDFADKPSLSEIPACTY